MPEIREMEFVSVRRSVRVRVWERERENANA
jgi:hypothetical protein